MKYLCVLLIVFAQVAIAQNIPMTKAGQTYYVTARVDGVASQYLVDTGAAMVALPAAPASAVYLRDMIGITADGRRLAVSVYQIPSLDLGGCHLENVEAAVVPGMQRPILGLSALRQASPFVFSIDPPELRLTCP